MPMPQQLTQISIFRTGYPHPRKAILQQQLQQQCGIQAVRLLLAHPLGLDLRRIPDPQLEAQFRSSRLNQRACPVASIPTRTLQPSAFSSR